MGSGYDYDTRTWIQRTPFVIVSLLHVLIVVLVIKQQLKNKFVLKLKYGRYALLMYCIAIVFTVILRLLYFYSGPGALPIPSVLYAISYFTPPLFMIAACAFFLNYLFNSLQSRFSLTKIRRYTIIKRTIQITLLLLWSAQGVIFVLAVHQNYTGIGSGSVDFSDIYQDINTTSYLLISIFLIYIIICYKEKLKQINDAHKNRQTAIILAIATTFIQVIARIANGIFLIRNTYKELEIWSNKKSFPYAQTWYATYCVLTDVFPLLSYTYYIEKDTENLGIFELIENEEAFIGTKPTSDANIIEESCDY